MGRDHDDVLDDPGGGLVWAEIETAVTLEEMIISTGASVPVFIGGEISITRVCCSSGEQYFYWGFYRMLRPTPGGTPLYYLGLLRATWIRMRSDDEC